MQLQAIKGPKYSSRYRGTGTVQVQTEEPAKVNLPQLQTYVNLCRAPIYSDPVYIPLDNGFSQFRFFNLELTGRITAIPQRHWCSRIYSQQRHWLILTFGIFRSKMCAKSHSCHEEAHHLWYLLSSSFYLAFPLCGLHYPLQRNHFLRGRGRGVRSTFGGLTVCVYPYVGNTPTFRSLPLSQWTMKLSETLNT